MKILALAMMFAAMTSASAQTPPMERNAEELFNECVTARHDDFNIMERDESNARALWSCGYNQGRMNGIKHLRRMN